MNKKYYIQNKIIITIKKYLINDTIPLKFDTKLIDDLKLDNENMIKLIDNLEKDLKIKIDIENIITINDLINYICQRKLNNKIIVKKNKNDDEIQYKKRNEIKNKIKNIVIEDLNIDMDFVSPGSNLREDLCYTNDEVYEFLLEVEDCYNIKIPYQDIPKILTIQDIINYVYQKTNLL
jgi:acyl carrier protein